MVAPDLDTQVGGIVHLEYASAGQGIGYSIHLAVLPFNPTPSGGDNDYLYTGAGTPVATESGVIATVAALATHWKVYYPEEWVLRLVRVYRNVAGFPLLMPVVPVAPAVPGVAAEAAALDAVVKRTLYLFSQQGSRWRVWLRQMPGEEVGKTLDVGTDTGGYDTRDQEWFSYISGSDTAIVARDGTRFQPGGRVRQWWDRPLSSLTGPYVVTG